MMKNALGFQLVGWWDGFIPGTTQPSSVIAGDTVVAGQNVPTEAARQSMTA